MLCKCERCSHEWKTKVVLPISCPKCKSYAWDKKKIDSGVIINESKNKR